MKDHTHVTTDAAKVNSDGSTTEIVIDYLNAVLTANEIEQTLTKTSGINLMTTTTTTIPGTGGDTTETTDNIVVNADGSRTETVTNFVVNGSTLAEVNQTKTTVSASGLTKTILTDITGKGVAFLETTDNTVLNSNGSRTETIINSFGKPGAFTELGQSVTTIFANGVGSATTTETNGLPSTLQNNSTQTNGNVVTINEILAPNGSFTQKNETVTGASGLTVVKYEWLQDAVNKAGNIFTRQVSRTTHNADGSTTTSIVNDRGTSPHDGSVTVKSQNGLTTTTNFDLNGDGNYNDLKTVDSTVLSGTGNTVKTETVTDTVANGSVRDQTVTTTTNGNVSITRNLGVNGGGKLDQKETIAVATATGGGVTAGDTIDTVSDLENDGVTAYETKTTTTSADGLSKTIQFTFATTYTVAAPSQVPNNLSFTYDPSLDYALSDVVTLPTTGANAGGRVDTFTETFGQGVNATVGETVVTTTSANGLTTTITASADDDTPVAMTANEQTTLNFDGAGGKSVAINVSNVNVGQSGALNATTTDSSLVTTSGSGLSITTSLDVNGDGANDVIDTVVFGDAGSAAGDGKRTETIKTFNPITKVLVEFDLITTSADGRTKTLGRESHGNEGFFDHVEQQVANPDGGVTNTITDFSAKGVRSSIIVVTTSADKLVNSTSFDTNADGVTDFARSSQTLLNADGSEVTTSQTTIGSAGLVWNKTVTTTSANGWTKNSNIYLNGDTTADETESDVTVLNSDGSTTETDKVTYAATGAVKSDTVTKVSANGRETIVDIYLNGTAPANRVEEKTILTTADGLVSQFNVYSPVGGITPVTATASAPDQNYTVTTFPDGSSAQTNFVPNRNGSYNWNDFDPNGNLVQASIHTIDSNNVDTWDYATYDLTGAVTKETIVTLDVATENKLEAVAARLYDTLLDRDMTAAEVQTLINFLGGDNLDATTLANTLMGSSEFAAKYGTTLTDSQFIERVYENALGRAPSLADFVSDLDQLDRKTLTRAGLANLVSETSEHVIDGNTHAITNNTFIGTTNYTLDHTMDAVVADGIVDRLFETSLNRDPTSSELSTYASDILNGSDTEAQVAGLLSTTSEFTSRFGSGTNVDALIVPLYLQALGRDPTSQELNSFTMAANDGDLSTADLITALAESPEHFIYGDKHVAYQSFATSGQTLSATNAVATFQSGASLGTVSGSGDGVAVLGGAAAINVTGSNDSIYLGGSGDRVTTSAASTLTAAFHNDTFILKPGFGKTTLNGFSTASGATDVIEFSKTEFANFAAVQMAMTTSGGATLITHGTDVLTLTNIAELGLTSAAFKFI